MAGNQVYVAAEDEVPAIIEVLRRVPADDVQLVLPMGARVGKSRFNFQLLKQYSTRLGKQIAIVSPDPAIQRIAEESGFTAYRALGHEGRPLAPEPRQPVALPESRQPVALPPPPPPVDPPPTRRIRAPSPPPPSAGMAAAGAAAMGPAAVAGGAPAAAAASPMASRLGSIGRIARDMPQPGAARIRVAAPARLPSRLATQVPGTRTFLYVGAALLLVAGVVAMLFYVPSAQVTLIADAKPFGQDIEFTAEAGKPPVRVRTQSVTKSLTKTGTASGVKTVPGQVANGQFTYVNACPSAYMTANGQRLRSSGGVLFAQLGDTVILPGQATTVNIRAVAPGVGGNVGAGDIRSIEGNSAGCLNGANQAPTTGGVDEQKKVAIQTSDLQAVQSELDRDLRQQIGDDLNKQAQKGEKLVLGAAGQPVINTDHNVDDEVQGFSMTMKLTLEGDFYQADDMVQTFTSLLQKKVPADQQLTSNRITVDPEVTSAGGGHLTFKGRPSGYTAPKLDLQTIPSRVTGKPPGQARSELATLPGVRSVQIQQFPFGLPLMPMSGSRIHVEYDVAAGPLPK